MWTIDGKTVFDFLNNQSVGAFLGAFAAFLLVVINDWKRERRKVKTLQGEIEINLAHARSKLHIVRQNRTRLREERCFTPARILRFNTSFTRQLAGEVLHHLSLDQRQAIEGLCYTMEAIDNLLDECVTYAQRLSNSHGPDEHLWLLSHVNGNMSDGVANLKRLIEMFECYLAGRCREILTKQYDPSHYEEP